MASIKQLETALVNADKAGDTDAARKLAAVIKRSREQAISPLGIPAGEEGPQAIPKPAPAPTIGEQVLGAGEAALALGTGATGGAVGFVGGTVKGMAEQILAGEFGTPQAAKLIQEEALKGSQALTYAPRTEAGQAQTQAIGEALQPLEAIAPLAGEIGMATRAARQAVPKVGGSRSWRNNNQGNIEFGEFAKRHGATGSDGRFAIFPSEEAGRAAQSALLKSKNYKNLDIPDMVKRYAPGTENNVPAYIAAVKKAGVDPKKKMGEYTDTEMNALLDAMKKHEGWKVGEGETAPKPTKMTTEDIGITAKKAAAGSAEAKQRLAIETDVNPEALKAAERLDIDVPIDVLSDSELLRQTVGLTRSQIGAESAAWREAVQNMANKADDVMTRLEGADSKAVISGKIKDALDSARGDIKTQTTKLYREVDSVVPKATIIEPKSLRQTLNEIASEVGGKEQMSPIEKKILSMIESDKITYGGLMREKTLVGEALAGKQTPYGNIGAASLKRLYGAIKNDQMDNVQKLGGMEAREKLHFANRLTVKQKALENRIIGAFGKEGEGSIASLMDRAITQGSKGDITALNKLLKAVPEEMQKEVIATAFTELTKSQRAGEAGMFDFARYAKLYQGLRRNAPIYKKIIDAVGKDKHQVMSDLYQISKRVTDARANVITTGKANQEILKGMQSENLISKIVDQTVAAVARKTTTGGFLMDKIITSPQDKIRQIGELLRSQEFKDLAVESATNAPSKAKVNKFIFSPSFKKWSKKVTKNKNLGDAQKILTDPRAWIYTSITQQEKDK